MKRLANGILLFVIMFLFIPSSFVFAKEFYEAVPFNVNVGKKIESMMVYNINGQNYFPIRELCENTGFECVWDQDENKIVITMDQPEKTDSLFTTISDTIILDLKNGDCTALTEYLDQNVSEFDKETCLLESINKQSEDGDYLITYRMFKSGLKTPNELLVFVDANGSMKYVNKLNNPMLSDIDFEFMNMDIEKAKQEAMNQYDGCVIIEQKVEERIDTNSKPYIYVETIYEDEDGSYFVEEYEYYLR